MSDVRFVSPTGAARTRVAKARPGGGFAIMGVSCRKDLS